MNRRDYERMMRSMQQAPQSQMFGLGWPFVNSTTVCSTFASTTMDMGPPPPPRPTPLDGKPDRRGQYTIPYEPPPPPTDGSQQILLFPDLFEAKSDEDFGFSFKDAPAPPVVTRGQAMLQWLYKYMPWLFAPKQEAEGD